MFEAKEKVQDYFSNIFFKNIYSSSKTFFLLYLMVGVWPWPTDRYTPSQINKGEVGRGGREEGEKVKVRKN